MKSQQSSRHHIRPKPARGGMATQEKTVRRRPTLFLFLLLLSLAACRPAGTNPPTPTPLPPAAASTSPAGTPIAALATTTTLPATTATPAASATPRPSPTPFPTSAVTPGPAGQCGLLLPVVLPPATPAVTQLDQSQSLELFPEAVRPAVAFMLANPAQVGLAAYPVGNPAGGVYLNANSPMPLASVVKIIHLVAYANAVNSGRLNPATTVPLADLDAYYLPGSDLNGHTLAVSELRGEGRVFGDPPAIFLEDVPRMMIQYSSNAATDYLHQLLGQETIEQTAINLGMSQQTAPCPWIGQFLIMDNPDGELSDLLNVRRYISDWPLYSVEVMNLTARFSSDPGFRAEIGTWRGRGQQPSIDVQRLFSDNLNAQGSAGSYAALMATIAQNQLGSWELSVLIRRYLEWPTFFPDNQQQLAWTGYKGGSLPGVLTAAYYAQPWWDTQPVVVALFYRDLPQSTYQQWRRELPNDELARWLLRDPEAIPLLRSVLAGGGE